MEEGEGVSHKKLDLLSSHKIPTVFFVVTAEK